MTIIIVIMIKEYHMLSVLLICVFQ